MFEDNHELFEAIEADDMGMLAQALFNGVNFRETDDKGRLPLALAAANQQLKMVDAMLWRGAPPNIVDGEGLSALMHATRVPGNEDVIQRLLQSGASTSQTDPRGMNALMIACLEGDDENLKAMLTHLPRLSHRSDDGNTIFDYLLADDHGIETFELLMLKGEAVGMARKERDAWLEKATGAKRELIEEVTANIGKVFEKSNRWTEAMNVAFMNSGVEVVISDVMDAQAVSDVIEERMEKQQRSFENTPDGRFAKLGSGSKLDQARAAEEAREKGMDPTDKLHKAIKTKNVIMLNEAMRAGADVNKIDEQGWNALHMAVDSKNISTVNTLLRRDANADHFDNNGLNPLMLAIALKNRQMVWSLAPKTDLTRANDNGETPLHLSTRLLEHGLDPAISMDLAEKAPGVIDLKDKMGKTPYSYAQHNQADELLGVFDMLSGRRKQRREDYREEQERQRKEEMRRREQQRHETHQQEIRQREQHKHQRKEQSAQQSNEKSSGISAVAMHEAAMSGNANMLKNLIKNGVNPNLPDANGRTPLMYAAMYHKLEATTILIERSNLGTQDQDGRNALMWALSQKDQGSKKQVVGMLAFHFKQGLAQKDKDGFNAMDYARALNDPVITRMLTDAANR